MREFSRWTCPGCARVYRLPAGKTPPDVCHKCRQALASGEVLEQKIPPSPLPTVFLPTAPTEAAVFRSSVDLIEIRRRGKDNLLVMAATFLFVSGLAVAFFTYGQSAALASYSGLIISLASGSVLAKRTWPHRTKIIRLIHWPIGISAILAFGWFDTYAEPVERAFGDFKVSGNTRYSRWGRVPLESFIRIDDPEGKMDSMAWGPLSPSGARHGEWRIILGSGGGLRSQWFWYGEEITEGEWHLRNR